MVVRLIARSYATLPWRSRKARARFHASSDSAANSSCFRSKKLCGGRERLLERLHVLDRDPGIGATHEREDGRAKLPGALRRSG
jgi:hypothetical protein